MHQVICVLGDSIANGYCDEEGLGWFSRLSIKIAKLHPHKFGFNNLAVSGDKSVNVLARLSGEALSRKPDILLIAVGINDIIRTGTRNGPYDVSLDYAFRTWHKILMLAKNTVSQTVVIGLLPIEENTESADDEENTNSSLFNNNVDIAEYNLRLKNMAETANICYIDVFSLWNKTTLRDNLYDGIHPNAKGHAELAEYIYAQLIKLNLLFSA